MNKWNGDKKRTTVRGKEKCYTKSTMTKLVCKSQHKCPHPPSGATPSSFIYSCLQEHKQINNCYSPVRGRCPSPNDYEMHDQINCTVLLGSIGCACTYTNPKLAEKKNSQLSGSQFPHWQICTLSLPESPPPFYGGSNTFPFFPLSYASNICQKYFIYLLLLLWALQSKNTS